MRELMAGKAVGMAVSGLQAREASGDREPRAVLARLRRDAGLADPLMADQELWRMVLEWLGKAITAHNNEAGEDKWRMPSRHDDEGRAVPTPTERAIAEAMVMYSRQSGSKDRFPHVPGVGFGKALMDSAKALDRDDGVQNRFMAPVFSSTSMTDLSHQLNRIAPRLSSGFDYARLANDLVTFQQGVRGRSSVIGRWSRQAYSAE